MPLALPDCCLAPYRDTHVVVLGATGFVGRWVARALFEQGARLDLVVRDAANAEAICTALGIDGNIVQCDLANIAAGQALLRDLRPAVTFNAVGYGIDRRERNEDMAYQINARWVSALCEALAQEQDPRWPGQQLIHVGSALEYGLVGGDLAETLPAQPTTLYGMSKLEGTLSLTERCQSLGLRGLTARLFGVYGPGEHRGRLLPSVLECARTGRVLELTAGDQKRDFTFVRDVAEGLLRLGLAAARPGEIVNLATGQLTSVRAFVEIAADVLEIPRERLAFGLLPTRSEEMVHDPVVLGRLRELTDWTAQTGIAEGIKQTVAFEKHYRDQMHPG